MKLFVYLIAIVNILLFSPNCKKSKNDVVEKPVTTLSATPTTFNSGTSGDTISIAITCNTNWQIESNSLWCVPSIKYSTGDATIHLYIAINKLNLRNCTLTLSADGASDISISISQEAFDYFIASDTVGMRVELSAIEFSHLLGYGWNLGNTLECISLVNDAFVGGETLWGNPTVTKQLIDSVKDAGFNSIRIPVAWSHRIIDQTTYQIEDTWLQRVKEVINYALDNDMYAIINIHWDGGWMNQPTTENQVEINRKIDALWKQIALYFRDYSDHLIFAGTNEVHTEGYWGTPTATNLTVQKSFNQTFVDAVRATEGKNTYRYLVVQAYNTNIDLAKNYLTMPTDITPDRLMAEVHFYDPYDFCLKEDVPYVALWSNSTWGKEEWVNTAFGYMKTKFVDNGIPVIMGEYGVVLRSSLTGQALPDHIASRNYYLGYVTHAAIQNGMVPFYWDNGYTGNNGFALFKRSDGSKVHPDALNAIINADKKK
jgi:endoglucanase